MEKVKDDSEELFEYVWKTILSPLFFDETVAPLLDGNTRKIKAFTRYYIGNLFLLIRHGIDISGLLKKLKEIETEEDMNYLIKIYEDYVFSLWLDEKIDDNEYHTYKNIFIMIPPNILKKGSY